MTNATLKPATPTKTILSDIEKLRANASKSTTAAKESDSRFAKMAENTFYKIMYDANMQPDEKQKALTQAMVFSADREANRARVAEYDLFQEYLQTERERMHSEIIKMSDPTNYALLRDALEELNTSMIQFEDDMRPLTDIIDAMHVLRTNNQTFEAFKEIKDEERIQEEVEAEEARILEQRKAIEDQIDALKADSDVARQKKGFFGGLKDSALSTIAKNNIMINRLVNDLKALDQRSVDNKARLIRESIVVDQEAKEKLRDMLNLASAEHTERSQKLINSASTFIETSKSKIQSARDQLNKLGSQNKNLEDAVGDITFIYALLRDGAAGAEAENMKVRADLRVIPEKESAVEKLIRENKQRAIDEHIGMLESSMADTVMTMADLSSSAIRIKNMRDSNIQQSHAARDMHTRGVAGIAERLSTTIAAIGAAAIAESNSLAASTLNAMNAKTDAVAQKESMRVASGYEVRSKDLEAAIESLAQYGEVNNAAIEITRSGITNLRNNLALMEQVAKEVTRGVNESRSIVADIVDGTDTVEEAVTAAKPKLY